jgi:hypothetical protein
MDELTVEQLSPVHGLPIPHRVGQVDDVAG